MWPPETRAAFCYSARQGKEESSCNAKEGSPFGPFWDHFNISFPRSELYSPLHYDTHHGPTTAQWRSRFPASSHPVLAFTGAPAAFPVQEQNVRLQRYVVWREDWRQEGRDWARDNLPQGPYVGVHLRNGLDWSRACEHATAGPQQLFSSPQCLGYRNQEGDLSRGLCMPELGVVVRQLRRAVKEVKAVAVFVASDSDHMLASLRQEFRNSRVSFHSQSGPLASPHLDLVLLGQANLLLANCVSSFSALAVRQRREAGLPTRFLGFLGREGEQGGAGAGSREEL